MKRTLRIVELSRKTRESAAGGSSRYQNAAGVSEDPSSFLPLVSPSWRHSSATDPSTVVNTTRYEYYEYSHPPWPGCVRVGAGVDHLPGVVLAGVGPGD